MARLKDGDWTARIIFLHYGVGMHLLSNKWYVGIWGRRLVATVLPPGGNPRGLEGDGCVGAPGSGLHGAVRRREAQGEERNGTAVVMYGAYAISYIEYSVDVRPSFPGIFAQTPTSPVLTAKRDQSATRCPLLINSAGHSLDLRMSPKVKTARAPHPPARFIYDLLRPHRSGAAESRREPEVQEMQGCHCRVPDVEKQVSPERTLSSHQRSY